MNISQIAKKCGLSAKTLRYYENIGLVAPLRADNDYRIYTDEHLQELIFLRRARQFGFSLKDCQQLLELLRNPGRQSHRVHQLASDKLAEMNAYIDELLQMRDELALLVSACANDNKPECAIINRLAEVGVTINPATK